MVARLQQLQAFNGTRQLGHIAPIRAQQGGELRAARVTRHRDAQGQARDGLRHQAARLDLGLQPSDSQGVNRVVHAAQGRQQQPLQPQGVGLAHQLGQPGIFKNLVSPLRQVVRQCVGCKHGLGLGRAAT